MCKKHIKVVLSIIATLCITNAYAEEELCKQWKPEITERRNETNYSVEKYMKALRGLEFYSNNTGIDPWPLFTIIEGYLLKMSVLTAPDTDTKKRYLESYCNFIVQEGVHRE